MSKEAIKYLQDNKNKYQREELVKLLKEAGYSDSDIKSSVQSVYGQMDGDSQQVSFVDNFLDFKSKKVYFNAKEKALDFIIGFVAPFLLGYIFSFFNFFGPVIVLAVYLYLLFYLFSRRRYIFWGMVFFIITTVVLAFIAIMLFFGGFYF